MGKGIYVSVAHVILDASLTGQFEAKLNKKKDAEKKSDDDDSSSDEDTKIEPSMVLVALVGWLLSVVRIVIIVRWSLRYDYKRRTKERCVCARKWAPQVVRDLLYVDSARHP